MIASPPACSVNSLQPLDVLSPPTTKSINLSKTPRRIFFAKTPRVDSVSPRIHHTGKTFKILMVDDVSGIRKIMERCLLELSEVFHQAANGDEALERVKTLGTSYYDVILMDGYMPQVRSINK